jgi:hypothetical protein
VQMWEYRFESNLPSDVVWSLLGSSQQRPAWKELGTLCAPVAAQKYLRCLDHDGGGPWSEKPCGVSWQPEAVQSPQAAGPQPVPARDSHELQQSLARAPKLLEKERLGFTFCQISGCNVGRTSVVACPSQNTSCKRLVSWSFSEACREAHRPPTDIDN